MLDVICMMNCSPWKLAGPAAASPPGRGLGWQRTWLAGISSDSGVSLPETTQNEEVPDREGAWLAKGLACGDLFRFRGFSTRNYQKQIKMEGAWLAES